MADNKPVTKDSTDVLKALKAACRGLLFPSESDKPIKAFRWDKAGAGDGAKETKETKDTADTSSAVDEAALRAAGKAPEGATVTQLPLDTFFDPVVTEEDWWGEEEKATAKRFQNLLSTLRDHLTDIKAFRVEGSGEDTSVVDAYVVGRTEAGDLAGVSTQLIET